MLSMTGYAKVLNENDDYRICVEAKSVNNKHLNVRIKSPSILNFLENKIKTIISKNITRGYIEIKIDFEDKVERTDIISYDKNLSKNYIDILSQMEKELDIKINDKSYHLLRQPNVINTKSYELDENLYSKAILDTVQDSLLKLNDMKKIEGERLKSYFVEMQNSFTTHYEKINELKDQVVKNYMEKLKLRLDKLDANIDVEEENLQREMLIFADKCDISEEVSRLSSHLSQFDIEIENEHNGKKIDFILQEMFREINTLGVKANLYDISKEVVECKTIIEKIREQVQNVE